MFVVCSAVTNSLSSCLLHDLVVDHSPIAFRLLSLLIRTSVKDIVSGNNNNNNTITQTEKNVVQKLLSPLVSHLLSQCVSYDNSKTKTTKTTNTSHDTNDQNTPTPSSLLPRAVDLFRLMTDAVVECLASFSSTTSLNSFSLSSLGKLILSTLVTLTVLASESKPNKESYRLTTDMRSMTIELRRALEQAKKTEQNQEDEEETPVFTTVDVSVTKIVESAHPYADNSNQMYSIDFPEFRQNLVEAGKPHKIHLTFSPQSKTERNCDYCQFWDNPQRSGSALSAAMSGNHSQLSQHEPVVLPAGCSTLWLQFKSDGSTHYWGYHIEMMSTIGKSIQMMKSSWSMDFKRCLGILDVMSVVPMMKAVDYSPFPKKNGQTMQDTGGVEGTVPQCYKVVSTAGVALRNSLNYDDRYTGCRGPEANEYVRGTVVPGTTFISVVSADNVDFQGKYLPMITNTGEIMLEECTDPKREGGEGGEGGEGEGGKAEEKNSEENLAKEQEEKEEMNKTMDIIKRIMNDPLLRFGLLPVVKAARTTTKKRLLRTTTEDNWSDPNQSFLMDVLNGENKGLAFAALMKRKCVRDRGRNPIINKAVVAVATALIHHHGLGNHAIALIGTNGTLGTIGTEQSSEPSSEQSSAQPSKPSKPSKPPKPSKELLQLWTAAQRIRNVFHTRVQDKSNPTQHDELSIQIVDACRFLLRLHPERLPRGTAKSKSGWDMLGLLRVSTQGSLRSASGRMDLAWSHLVDQAMDAESTGEGGGDRLKALLGFRRAVGSETSRTGIVDNALIDRVVSFVQLSEVVGLEQIERYCDWWWLWWWLLWWLLWLW